MLVKLVRNVVPRAQEFHIPFSRQWLVVSIAKQFSTITQDPLLYINPVPDDTLPVQVDVVVPIESFNYHNASVGPAHAHFPDIELDNEQETVIGIPLEAAGLVQLHLAQNDHVWAAAGRVQPVEEGNLGSVAETRSEIGKYC